MSFLNRCMIPAANGVLKLSVPVIGGRGIRDLVKEVRIDNSADWQTRHWRTIFSAYGRSPWFEYYRDGLESFYLKRYAFLGDWNLALLEWVYHSLGHKTQLIPLYEAPKELLNTQDIRHESAGGNPASNKVNRCGERLTTKNFHDPEKIISLPVYGQVFEDRIGFQFNMSIIDLIFCEGSQALKLLKDRVS